MRFCCPLRNLTRELGYEGGEKRLAQGFAALPVLEVVAAGDDAQTGVKSLTYVTAVAVL